MATISFPSGVTTFVVNASEFNGQDVVVSGKTYYSVKNCGRYAIYYTNAFGAWDAYLFESKKCIRKDTLGSFEYHTDYLNTDPYGRGRRKYVTEVVPAWTLYTTPMTDEEAERFAKHVVPSQNVYLHDLDEDVLYPVVITDNTVDWKTRANNGRKLITYTLNVKASQDIVRR